MDTMQQIWFLDTIITALMVSLKLPKNTSRKSSKTTVDPELSRDGNMRPPIITVRGEHRGTQIQSELCHVWRQAILFLSCMHHCCGIFTRAPARKVYPLDPHNLWLNSCVYSGIPYVLGMILEF